MSSGKKTDNTNAQVKVALRAKAVNDLGLDRVKVLDCFAGEGVLWRGVREVVDCELSVLPIERLRSKADHRTVVADNRKVLAGIELDHFDLIDLDAYGWPTQQLELLRDRGYDGQVVTTCCFGPNTRTPNTVLEGCGIPLEWLEVSPILFSREGIDWWDRYLALQGFTRSTRFHLPRVGGSALYEILYRQDPRTP